ncbi:MAG: hypothetical protein ACFFGZ_14715 [Candidatus Thorarchaeota archaeon]
MLGELMFFSFSQEQSQTANELLKFDYCRKIFEKRLHDLGEEASQRFGPIAEWMRLVIAEKAPELLNKT